MITTERLGVRPDGNPIVETSIYIEAAPDHPLAVQVEGHIGYWVRTFLGNSLATHSAVEVTRMEWNAAKSALEEHIAQVKIDREARDEIIREEMKQKKDKIRLELIKLGLSEQTVSAILQQVQQG